MSQVARPKPSSEHFETDQELNGGERLLFFRTANIPNTRINAATMLSTIWRLVLIHGTTKRFRIGMARVSEGKVTFSPVHPAGTGILRRYR
jgi:hypothetical protein